MPGLHLGLAGRTQPNSPLRLPPDPPKHRVPAPKPRAQAGQERVSDGGRQLWLRLGVVAPRDALQSPQSSCTSCTRTPRAALQAGCVQDKVETPGRLGCHSSPRHPGLSLQTDEPMAAQSTLHKQGSSEACHSWATSGHAGEGTGFSTWVGFQNLSLSCSEELVLALQPTRHNDAPSVPMQALPTSDGNGQLLPASGVAALQSLPL